MDYIDNVSDFCLALGQSASPAPLLFSSAAVRLAKCHHHLYKYFTPADYNFQALEKGELFFNSFLSVNDPFEVCLPFSEEKLLEAVVSRMGKEEEIKALRVNLEDIRSKFRSFNKLSESAKEGYLRLLYQMAHPTADIAPQKKSR